MVSGGRRSTNSSTGELPQLSQQYRVIKKLGSGGMGEVYLVEHRELGRREAIKVLRRAVARSEQFIGRFRREARATNRLQHPNIVSIYDFGCLPDGRLYLSIEFAEGESLGQVLRRDGWLSVSRSLRLLDQLAGAIDHAHNRGVIHRDLKPDNLIVTRERGGDEVLKVLDFGLAKVIAPDYEDSVCATEQGDLLGTPSYMAPEQFTGKADNPRIDIYAFGCVAFQMLVGEPLFVGRPMAVFHAHVNSPPRRPSEVRYENQIPNELDALVLRCLDKNPDRRFQTGEEVLAALRGVPGYGDGDSGRRSRRSYELLSSSPQPANDFDPVGTDVDPQVTGPKSPNPASLSQARYQTQSALRGLAELLLDLGCSDFRLLIGMADIGELENEVAYQDARLEELTRRGRREEQLSREREATLRFALGELRFDRDQAAAHGQTVTAEVERQIADLDRRLKRLVRGRQQAQLAITDEQVAVAAAVAHKDDELSARYAALQPVIVDIASRYQDQDPVARMCRRLQTTRETLEAVERGR